MLCFAGVENRIIITSCQPHMRADSYISMWVCKNVLCGLAVAFIMLTSQILSVFYCLNGAALENVKGFNLPTFVRNSGVNTTPHYADFGVE
jgi:hypothetical protein